jgi:hypothetical protein
MNQARQRLTYYRRPWQEKNKPKWLMKPDEWDRIKAHVPIVVQLEFWIDGGRRHALIDNRGSWCIHDVTSLRRIVPQAQECMRDIAGGLARSVRVRRMGEAHD